MSATLKLDARRFHESIARAMRAGHLGREAVLRQVGTRALIAMRGAAVSRANDTGRFLRGFDMAQNDLAVRTVPLTPLRPAKLHKSSLKRLGVQAALAERVAQRWEKDVAGYARKGGDYASWPSYRKAVAIRDKAIAYSERAHEELRELQGDPTSIVLGGAKAKNEFAVRKLSRAFGRVYGATARVQLFGQRTVLIVVHKEPHARIVEKRTGIVKNTLALYRGLGVGVRQTATRHYLRALFPRQARAA